MVTGSIDHAVRVWDPFVPTKPVAILTNHSTAVLAVVIASDVGLIFSYSHDAVSMHACDLGCACDLSCEYACDLS